MLPERTLPKEIIEAFSKIDVPNISDAMNRVGVTVSIAGIQVNPGDLICGDGNGAVAVPFERAEEVLKTALEIEAAEKEIIERLNAGMSFLEASRQI